MTRIAVAAMCLAAGLATPLEAQRLPPLPTAQDRPPHVLAVARAADGAMWVGTYGDGIYAIRPGSDGWRQMTDDTSAASLSWGFVHAFAFGPASLTWYGTVGNGWGVSADEGRSWRNWTLRELGPEYQYVVPNGIARRGDTVYIATADGVKLSWDGGESWRIVTDSMGARDHDDVWGHIGNQYVLAFAVDPSGQLWLSHVHGVERSADGGRTWQLILDTGASTTRNRIGACAEPLRRVRVRAFGFTGDTVLMGTEHGVVVRRIGGAPSCLSGSASWGAVQQIGRLPDGTSALATNRGVVLLRGTTVTFEDAGFVTSLAPLVDGPIVLGTYRGVVEWEPGASLAIPTTADATGDVALPGELRHTWFRRPVAEDDQPYIDQTYRYGSTMGGNFQQHQGVEFNGGEGTVTRAIGDGVVAFAGPAEAGALTVAIRHDRTLDVEGHRYFLYSVYYHHSALLVRVGQRVAAGEPIGRIGNTGRATNDHLHLEVHATPVDDVSLIVNADVRYPPYTTNPELWIAPLPGTGVVAGRVFDAAGRAVPQARVYGLYKPEPQETPFAFAETYGDRTRGTPAYREHFAVGGVPPGDYVLETRVGGVAVRRKVRVAAGRLTWVEFRP